MAEVEAEKEVRVLLERIVEALNLGDGEALAPLLSDRPGSVHIGTDPTEWWSKEQLVAGVKEATASDPQVRSELDQVAVHAMGDVAWAEGRGRFVNRDGRQRDVRTTGVFVREGGVWRSAQQHASIGIDNSALFGS